MTLRERIATIIWDHSPIDALPTDRNEEQADRVLEAVAEWLESDEVGPVMRTAFYATEGQRFTERLDQTAHALARAVRGEKEETPCESPDGS